MLRLFILSLFVILLAVCSVHCKNRILKLLRLLLNQEVAVSNTSSEKTQADVINLYESAQAKLKRLKELKAEVRLLSKQFKNEKSTVKGKQTKRLQQTIYLNHYSQQLEAKFRISLRKSTSASTG
uniref:Uncharacterized protein n=1 Tax=Ditylenchus dipsaci TaxID=166011 RepID=A0A915DQH5_9BILA